MSRGATRRQRRNRKAAKEGSERVAGAPRSKGSRDLLAFVQRGPVPSPLPLAIAVTGAVLGNGYLLWRTLHGSLTPSGIVLLVLVEGILLTLLATAQPNAVPPGHRTQLAHPHPPPGRRVIAWTAFVVGVGGAYLMWALVLEDFEALLGLLTGWQPWVEEGLDIALAITLGFAVSAWVADGRQYRQHGPPLVSSVDLEATCRRATFIYGAMVIPIPMFAALGLSYWLARWQLFPHPTPWPVVGGLLMVAAFFGSFFLAASTAAGSLRKGR